MEIWKNCTLKGKLEAAWNNLIMLIFYCVNDNVEVDLENTLIMRCIHCYQNLVTEINPKTQLRKGSISYYNTNGITFLKKHVDENHSLITRRFEEKMNNLWKVLRKDNHQRKEQIHLEGQFLKNVLSRIPSKKRMCHNFYIYRTLVC